MSLRLQEALAKIVTDPSRLAALHTPDAASLLDLAPDEIATLRRIPVDTLCAISESLVGKRLETLRPVFPTTLAELRLAGSPFVSQFFQDAKRVSDPAEVVSLFSRRLLENRSADLARARGWCRYEQAVASLTPGAKGSEGPTCLLELPRGLFAGEPLGELELWRVRVAEDGRVVRTLAKEVPGQPS